MISNNKLAWNSQVSSIDQSAAVESESRCNVTFTCTSLTCLCVLYDRWVIRHLVLKWMSASASREVNRPECLLPAERRSGSAAVVLAVFSWHRLGQRWATAEGEETAGFHSNQTLHWLTHLLSCFVGEETVAQSWFGATEHLREPHESATKYKAALCVIIFILHVYPGSSRMRIMKMMWSMKVLYKISFPQLWAMCIDFNLGLILKRSS